MEKSIRVRILGRDYPLIVREEDESLTRDMAAYVDAKMQAFKQAHPEQSEVITAVVTALSLAEELFTAREQGEQAAQALNNNLDLLDAELAAALSDNESERSS